MIVKIVCAGLDHFSKLYKPDEGEYLIGVDAGVDTLIKNRLRVDLAIGDFDSSKTKDLQKKCKKVVSYDSHKDQSDLELTLQYLSLNYSKIDYLANKVIDNIYVYNATGKRLDHYHATINVLIKYTHLNIKLIDKNNLIYIVNSKTEFKKHGYKYISFFSVDENTVISLKGFKYNLNNYQLKNYDSICLSNEIVEEKGILETNNKKILVIQSN
ncbi:MAG TPA: thiamine diphosphokinase [Bacilli bacterium]